MMTSRSKPSGAPSPHQEPHEDDPEIVAMDILTREAKEVERGHNGRAWLTQVQATTLARAYLDSEAKLSTAVATTVNLDLEKAELVEQYATAQKALRDILALDPRLTHDGYERDDLCRYEDEVYAIAEAASSPASTPKGVGGAPWHPKGANQSPPLCRCGQPRNAPYETVVQGEVERSGWKCVVCRWWNWSDAPSPASEPGAS